MYVYMGCCTSTGYFAPTAYPNLEKADGLFTSGLGEITTRRTGFILKCETHGEKQTTPWSAYFVRDAGSGKPLDIKNHTGRVVYHILPHGCGRATTHNFRENSLARMKMHITCADGSKAAVLKRMMYIGGSSGRDIASDGTYMLYSYAPSFNGQQSTEQDKDGQPLYPYAVMPDPEVGLPKGVNEREKLREVRRFKASDACEDAVCVLRYLRLEDTPFRMVVKGPPGAHPASDENEEVGYDANVIATAASDPYLMSISGGRGADGKYFRWNKEFDSRGRRDAEWGVDCAKGVDSLLLIATVITAGANGMGDARGSIAASTGW